MGSAGSTKYYNKSKQEFNIDYDDNKSVISGSDNHIYLEDIKEIYPPSKKKYIPHEENDAFFFFRRRNVISYNVPEGRCRTMFNNEMDVYIGEGRKPISFKGLRNEIFFPTDKNNNCTFEVLSNVRVNIEGNYAFVTRKR